MRLVESSYSSARNDLLNELIEVPAVRSDVEMLTILAFLPNPYYFVRQKAEQLLAARAEELAADPRTSTRTLYVLLMQWWHPVSTAVTRIIADHPNARNSPALLARLVVNRPEYKDALVASVAAPPDLKASLSRYIDERQRGIDSTAWALLRDPRVLENTSILSVLAHLGGQELMWAASRHLPEDALLAPDDYPFRAIH